MRFKLLVLLTLAASLICGAAASAAPAAGKTPTPEKKPKWIPAPPPTEESRFIRYHISALYQDSLEGQRAFTIFDVTVRRRLDEHSVTTEGSVRFKKTSSNQDDSDSIELRTAKLTFIEPWFQASAGRMDLGEYLTPMAYFGSYPTMGIRRLDVAGAIFPIKFAFGIEDYKSVTAPPTAASIFYIPSLFSSSYTDFNGGQAFALGQARARFNIQGVETTFRFNIGGSKSEYFAYSSVNGRTAYSASLDLRIARDYSLYTEYGLQNSGRKETAAFAYGARADRIGTWGPFSLDELTFEMQLPPNKNTANPFTGGNSVTPSLGQEAKTSWYGKIRARAKAVFFEGHVTNSVGDYTFARLTPEALNIPLPTSFGPSNEADGARVPFLSKSYTERAFLFRAGVEF